MTSKILRGALRIGVIYPLANLLSAARFVVEGDSMEPSFVSGQYLLVSRLAYLSGAPVRGDVVVLYDPARPGKECIKRIVGLPGEHVSMENGQLFVNGHSLEEPYVRGADSHRSALPEEWSLGDEEYVVLGDKRDDSRDSRSIGPLQRGAIVGKAWLRYWPRSAWGIIPDQTIPKGEVHHEHHPGLG